MLDSILMPTKSFKKIQYRLKRILYKMVPHNIQYKPVGAYKTSKEFYELNKSKNIHYIEVFPNYVTSLKVPEDLFNVLSTYKVYDDLSDKDKHTLTVQTNYHVIEIPKGRIYTDNALMTAIITEDNKIIQDVSYQHTLVKSSTPPVNSIFSIKYFNKPTKYKGVVFSAITGGGAVHNYGHWLIDVLPRICLLKESGLFDKVDWFLVPNYQYDYHKESLKLLGIDENKIINCQLNMHIEADMVITSTAPRGTRSFIIPVWIIELYKKYFLTDQILDNKPYPELVYISRKDSNLRRVLNEDQVIEVLKDYGFETIVSSKLSFQEKINLFHKAKVIVSASSAGLGSLFFSSHGGKLLEIFSQGFVHTHYYNIAKFVGMEYYSLVCWHPSPAVTGREGEREDITVEIDKLKQSLKRIFATRPAETLTT